jgi:glutathione synthase
VKYRIAVIMDPIEHVAIDKDTTFAFMLEAQSRGHELFYFQQRHLSASGNRASARAWRCEVKRAAEHYHLLDQGADYPLEHFHAILMRKDPPVDSNYLYATMILSLIDRARTFVMNEPAGLREANEKLYALNFPRAIPPTLVTEDKGRLSTFMEEQGGDIVVKPLDGHGGNGVFVVSKGDRNVNAIFETVTQFESRPIMAQKFLPEVRETGDKRLIVLNGEPLGAIFRVPRGDENRSNLHVGGTPVKSPLTVRDREICAMLKPRLLHDGLYFVGLDIIGDYLTEVNVTSPTGVQEIDRLDAVNLEAEVIDFVEARITALG